MKYYYGSCIFIWSVMKTLSSPLGTPTSGSRLTHPRNPFPPPPEGGGRGGENWVRSSDDGEIREVLRDQ